MEDLNDPEEWSWNKSRYSRAAKEK
jgi:hypothetical protein